MNVLMFSPGFPAEMPRFTRGLARVGAGVLGLGDQPPAMLPEDVTTREFFLTSVQASVGPLSVDLVAVAFVLGPVTLSLNFLTLVGIAIVALVVRSWI